MSRPLDVLVIESRPGAAAEAVRALEEAGHRPLTCRDEASGLPCRGVASPDDCPLAHRPDVALLVRSRVDPRVTSLETGARCALRAGVPVVESGSAALDPFEPWLAGRVGAEGVVAACEAGAARALDELRREIFRRVAPTLSAVGIPVCDARCTVEDVDLRLRVRFDLPAPVDRAVQQALAVRVLDALRSSRRTFGGVDVSVHLATVPGGAAPA
jgi:hypothetical protein